MTRDEALAVRTLVEWITSLTLWEIPPGHATIPDHQLVQVVGMLAGRAYAVLGAGMDEEQATAAAVRALGWIIERPEDGGQ